MAPDVKDQNAQDKANEEAAHKEAYAYWGYLIREDKCGTDIFNRLLEGIAEVVVSATTLAAQDQYTMQVC